MNPTLLTTIALVAGFLIGRSYQWMRDAKNLANNLMHGPDHRRKGR